MDLPIQQSPCVGFISSAGRSGRKSILRTQRTNTPTQVFQMLVEYRDFTRFSPLLFGPSTQLHNDIRRRQFPRNSFNLSGFSSSSSSFLPFGRETLIRKTCRLPRWLGISHDARVVSCILWSPTFLAPGIPLIESVFHPKIPFPTNSILLFNSFSTPSQLLLNHTETNSTRKSKFYNHTTWHNIL